MGLREILVGKVTTHLVEVSPLQYLQPEAKQAFLALQKSAEKAGFSLQIASAFRDFSRQQYIWNNKFNGKSPVLNEKEQILDLTDFNDWQKCQAILHFSALPGLSRHHWGTDIDIYDPTLLPKNKTLQLTAWEYGKQGYFFALTEWLKVHAPIFDFYFPFLDLPLRYRIGNEPWHLSYRPLSCQMARQMTKETLYRAWQGEEIAGKSTLINHLDDIFHHYFIKEM